MCCLSCIRSLVRKLNDPGVLRALMEKQAMS
jgi:hypothetical protein